MELEIVSQFGRIQEMARVLFRDKLIEYFKTPDVIRRCKEIPTIEKYEITEKETDKFATALSIINYFPDLFQKLPMIAITTVSGRKRPLTVGFPVIYVKNYYPFIVSSFSEPYVLEKNDNLIFLVEDKKYEIVFYENAFSNFSSVSIDDLSNYFDQILGFIRVREISGKLAFVDLFDRRLLIEGGTAVSKLGFYEGQTVDKNKFYEYSVLSEDFDVLIDVLASDRNQRIEIMDLICSLLGFYAFENNLGNWFTSIGQIVFRDSYSRRGESEQVLQGAPYQKVYADSLTVPVTGFVYLERIKINQGINEILSEVI